MAELPLRARDGSIRAVTRVDDEDVEKVLSISKRWSLSKWGYAVGKGGTIRLHRVVMGLEVGDTRQVDHIDRDKLNNRKSNLRIVTSAVNQMNVSSRGGSSGFRGVTWVPSRGKWQAQAQVDYKYHWLGYYETQEEAAEAARAFRMEHGALD